MGFMPLLSWIALISLQLGIINLFPIPVFDGGQLFVLILEGIFRRDLSPKARQIWMQIGFVIFVVLIVLPHPERHRQAASPRLEKSHDHSRQDPMGAR